MKNLTLTLGLSAVALLASCVGGGGGGLLPPDPELIVLQQRVKLRLRAADEFMTYTFLSTDGYCVIDVPLPDTIPDNHLVGFSDPDTHLIWKDLGRRVDQCLDPVGSALSVVSDPYGDDPILFEGSVRLTVYDAPETVLGNESVGAASWATNDIHLISSLLEDDDLYYTVLGHEVWHLIAGDFHE